MTDQSTEFKAIGVINFEDWKNPKTFTYHPQEFRPNDIEIKIQACGICGSDIHAANGDWGTETQTPFAVGHEIVGIVTKVGPESKHKVGDRVGVGAQCDCCHKCARCENAHQNTCRKMIGTYTSVYPETGVPTQGGYASHIRVCSDFVFKIPDNLETNDVAPLLCGGITAFRPLMTMGITKGSKIGISGIGGIGHMGILFAKALGAEVTAISRNNKKREIALQLGADHYIATDEEGFSEKYADSLDFILNTGSSFSEGALQEVLNLLTPYGKMTFITGPPMDEKITLSPYQLLLNSVSIGGSCIGSPKDIEYMLDVVSKNGIKPLIETIDINEENVKTAWERMEKGDVKFRFVLTGYDKYFN